QVVRELDRVGGVIGIGAVVDVDDTARVVGRGDVDVLEVVERPPDDVVGAVDRDVDADAPALGRDVVVRGVGRGGVAAGGSAAGVGEIAQDRDVIELQRVGVGVEDAAAGVPDVKVADHGLQCTGAAYHGGVAREVEQAEPGRQGVAVGGVTIELEQRDLAVGD